MAKFANNDCAVNGFSRSADRYPNDMLFAAARAGGHVEHIDVEIRLAQTESEFLVRLRRPDGE